MTSSTYKITVVKSAASAITNANIYITLYGEHGNTTEIYFDNKANELGQGNVSVFTINSQEVGNIVRVRIRYENGEDKSAPVLTSVLLDEERTGKEWVCSRNRWLGDDENGSSLVRELNCSKV